MYFGDWEMCYYCDFIYEDVESYVVWCMDWQNVVLINGEGFQVFIWCVECFIL